MNLDFLLVVFLSILALWALRLGLSALRPALCLTFFLLFFAPWPQAALADIYGYRDKDGFLRFLPAGNDRKSGEQSASTGKGDPGGTVEGIIHRASMLYNVEPPLLKAMIKVESDFDHMAVSRKGAMGLMQLMPETARDMDVSDPFDPAENITGGTRYLSLLLERFKHDLRLTLAAYNAGPERVASCGGVPPILETRAYVSRVMRVYERYKGKEVARRGDTAITAYKVREH